MRSSKGGLFVVNELELPVAHYVISDFDYGYQ